MPKTETLLVAAEKMSRRETSWSDIPADILSVITNRLETRLEFCSFRSVCKTCQGAASMSRFAGKDNVLSQILPYHFSITLLSQEYQHPPQILADEPLVLVSNSVFLVESIEYPNNPPFLFATEEFNPGKLNLRKPLGRYNYGTLPKNFPQNLDLSRFHVLEISRLYTLTKGPDPLDDLTRKNRSSRMFDKVIIFTSTNESKNNNNTITPEIQDYSLMMLYNNGGRSGLLAKISLGDGLMSPLHGHGDMKFDDIVMFQGRLCAVDRKGRGFWIDNGVLGEMFAMDKTTTGEDFKGCWKKRLVEYCGELCLVTRCPMLKKVAFEVYKLNEKNKTWDKLDGIGKDRIIFATVDGCFFVLARDLPACSGNCIVVGRDVFPSYNTDDDELESYWECPDIAAAFDVVIFDFGSGEWRPIEIDPEYNKVLYPQPWLSLDANMSKLFSRKGKEIVQDSFPEKCPDSSSTREASSSLGHRLDEQANDISFHISDIVLENMSTENLSALALGITNLCDELNTVAGSALTNTEPLKSGVIAKTKFQGIEVSPDLIPTLEEIWANHGNIFEESMIRGEYALRWGLESIAKMAILVENSLDGSLSESQADYVCSTLYHLQNLRFNISWLAPSIVKAFNMYYSIANIEARRLTRGG